LRRRTYLPPGVVKYRYGLGQIRRFGRDCPNSRSLTLVKPGRGRRLKIEVNPM